MESIDWDKEAFHRALEEYGRAHKVRVESHKALGYVDPQVEAWFFTAFRDLGALTNDGYRYDGLWPPHFMGPRNEIQPRPTYRPWPSQ